MVKEEITIKLEVEDAITTDLAHWIMSTIVMWNQQMPRDKMSIISFEAKGRTDKFFTTEDMQDFFDKFRKKLNMYVWSV